MLCRLPRKVLAPECTLCSVVSKICQDDRSDTSWWRDAILQIYSHTSTTASFFRFLPVNRGSSRLAAKCTVFKQKSLRSSRIASAFFSCCFVNGDLGNIAVKWFFTSANASTVAEIAGLSLSRVIHFNPGRGSSSRFTTWSQKMSFRIVVFVAVENIIWASPSMDSRFRLSLLANMLSRKVMVDTQRVATGFFSDCVHCAALHWRPA